MRIETHQFPCFEIRDSFSALPVGHSSAANGKGSCYIRDCPRIVFIFLGQLAPIGYNFLRLHVCVCFCPVARARAIKVNFNQIRRLSSRFNQNQFFVSYFFKVKNFYLLYRFFVVLFSNEDTTYVQIPTCDPQVNTW